MFLQSFFALAFLIILFFETCFRNFSFCKQNVFETHLVYISLIEVKFQQVKMWLTLLWCIRNLSINSPVEGSRKKKSDGNKTWYDGNKYRTIIIIHIIQKISTILHLVLGNILILNKDSVIIIYFNIVGNIICDLNFEKGHLL